MLKSLQEYFVEHYDLEFQCYYQNDFITLYKSKFSLMYMAIAELIEKDVTNPYVITFFLKQFTEDLHHLDELKHQLKNSIKKS